MIEIRAKSIWQGKVGVRDKYVKLALETAQGLSIKKDNELMIIPANQVKEKIVAKSESSFEDKYGKAKYFLYYFNWQPSKVQEKLL